MDDTFRLHPDDRACVRQRLAGHPPGQDMLCGALVEQPELAFVGAWIFRRGFPVSLSCRMGMSDLKAVTATAIASLEGRF
jgi:hypothetical protein